MEIGTTYLAPGHHTQICHIFLATSLTEGPTDREESEEGMETKKVFPTELEKLIETGQIKDSQTIAAFSFLKIKKIP